MTSRADERYSESDDDDAPRVKRRKGPKACDVCRRKKSDPDPSNDPQKPCVNCALFNTECTYTYIAKKRKTQQACIDALQDRLVKLESLLTSVAPNIDISKELETTNRDGPSSRHSTSQPAQPPPPKYQYQSSPTVPPPLALARDVDPAKVAAAFTNWRDPQSSSDDNDDEDEDEEAYLPFTQENAETHPHRFHGKSSGVFLVQRVMGMRRTLAGSTEASQEPYLAPLPEFPWEEKVHNAAVNFHFPPQDLQEHLIDIYFRCINPFFPLLHRPSFDANYRDGLHTRDHAFGAVLLMLFAAAARYSDDPRVLSQTLSGTDRSLLWPSAGWDYYLEILTRYRRPMLHTTTVQDLQMMALGAIYLQGNDNPSSSWHMAGLGVRLALDVGAHRKKMPRTGDKLHTELWKRAFWVLVVLDRMGSANLGRPCAIWEEDIDVDLPLEVDDEYMTEAADFKQPPNQPSHMTCFCLLVRLSHILSAALRTIYPISKKKSMFSALGDNWEQDIVASLDSSLNSFVDDIPEYLRWDPNHTTCSTTFYQSAFIYCNFYHVQIFVHRPYITKSSALAFPSLAICTNAARACAHVVEALRRRGNMLVFALLNQAAFASAILLLFNVWGMNKPGARVDCQSQLTDVYNCVRFIDMTKTRWRIAERMGDIIRGLASVGEIPLPQGASPPYVADSQVSQSGQKRPRDSAYYLHDSQDGKSPSSGSALSSLDSCCTPEPGAIPPLPPPPPPLLLQGYAPVPGGGVVGDTKFAAQPDHHHHHHQGAKFGAVKQDPYVHGDNVHALQYDSAFDMKHLMPATYAPGAATTATAAVTVTNPTPLSSTSSSSLETALSLFPYGGAPPPHPPPLLHAAHGQGHSADDVLTALDSVYFSGGAHSSLGDGVVMDVARHTFDVWGTATSGFQWAEWHQFADAMHGAPPVGGVATGYSQGSSIQHQHIQ